MKSITTKSITTKTLMRKRRAVSAIVGIMLGLGLTAVAAGGLYVMTSDLSDSAITISSVEIQNPRLYLTGDDAYLSMNIKNTGTSTAKNMVATVLLQCNGGTTGTFAVIAATAATTTTAAKPAVALTDECASLTGVTAGSLRSYFVGSQINSLEPGETASISGAVEVWLTATTSEGVKLVGGEKYLIQINGVNSEDEPIIQTASVRVR